MEHSVRRLISSAKLFPTDCASEWHTAPCLRPCGNSTAALRRHRFLRMSESQGEMAEPILSGRNAGVPCRRSRMPLVPDGSGRYMRDMQSPLVRYRRPMGARRIGGALRVAAALIRREGGLVWPRAPWSAGRRRAHIWLQLDSNLAGCGSRTLHIASSLRPRLRLLSQVFLESDTA